jgi:Fructose-1-6-bisphosphatase, C-terminal domain
MKILLLFLQANKGNIVLPLILLMGPVTLTATLVSEPSFLFIKPHLAVLVMSMIYYDLDPIVSVLDMPLIVLRSRFCLDATIGEFIRTREKMAFPEDGGKLIYSVNEGNSQQWDEPIKAVIAGFKSGPKPYTSRYVGSMVADIHRTILYGGIYLYPTNTTSPKGKLRLLYEGIPMAMIIEQAGGIASTGMFQGKIRRVLDLIPAEIHAKCPIIMGGKRDIQKVYDEYAKLGVDVPLL